MSRIGRALIGLVGVGISALIGNAFSREAQLRSRADYFAGKVVLITGASRGIGRALALEFAGRGAHLVLAARSADQLSAVCDECKVINPESRIQIVPTDVTNEKQLHDLVVIAMSEFKRIDVLVNNAGIMQGGAIHEMSDEAVRQHFEVNVMATIRLTQLVLPHMLERNSGHVVIMASHAGQISLPFFAAYSATKHALIGFGGSLRRELAGTRIRTTVLKPGFADTDFVSASKRAWRRMGLPIVPPEQVARRAVRSIQLGDIVVNMGIYETFGGWVNALAPVLVDLWWRVLAPRDLKQIAEGQKTK